MFVHISEESWPKDAFYTGASVYISKNVVFQTISLYTVLQIILDEHMIDDIYIYIYMVAEGWGVCVYRTGQQGKWYSKTVLPRLQGKS